MLVLLSEVSFHLLVPLLLSSDLLLNVVEHVDEHIQPLPAFRRLVRAAHRHCIVV